MKTLKDFITESNQPLTVKLVGSPKDSNTSTKYDVHHKGEHVASIYKHPEGDAWGSKYEIMKPHSNKEWEEDRGDKHHDFKTHPLNYKTLSSAVSVFKTVNKL